MILKDKLAEQIPVWRERVKKLVKENGNTIVDRVSIEQIYGGMRDVKSLVSDISYVHPIEGIRLRGYSIPELLAQLPRLEGMEMPLVGGLYYLLLIGEIPTLEIALEVEKEWQARSRVPDYVFNVIRSMPVASQPMTLFSQGILSLQSQSNFTLRYNEGMRKEEYWEAMLEDSMNLIAKLPTIAAFIYSLQNFDGTIDIPGKNLDWSASYAYMMGFDDREYADLSRLYFIIHSDHESGNVSAHATHMVASTLSDIYYAASAGMNGLAGPLHGRANQESLRWLLEVINKYGRVPTKNELTQYAWDTLKAGQVIPGYGHAVLRQTDPRYTVLLQFGKQHFPDDKVFSLANLVHEVVPNVLIEQGKAKNPWPNVDAISGAVQYHYGIRDCKSNGSCGFYTVLFGVSRILGVSANAIWARALGQPLERPKSLTTSMLEEITRNQ